MTSVSNHPLARASRGGLGLIAGAALLWGTVGVTTQTLYGLSATNALSVGFFRLALATPALLLACMLLIGRRAWRLPGRDAAIAVLIGALLGAYQLCYFTAIRHTGVTVATLVTLCTAPVLAAVLSGVVLRERVTGAVALALVGAVLGAGLLVGVQPEGVIPDALRAGVLYALGSALGYAAVTVCGRLISPQAHPLQVNAIAFPVGALCLLALALPGAFVGGYGMASWGLLLYLGLAPTALAFWLFLAGVRQTSATAATLVTLLEPLTAALLAWALFGERLGPLGLAGAALLLLSLAVLARRPREAE
jgi:DME family drug/metabolite transporter